VLRDLKALGARADLRPAVEHLRAIHDKLFGRQWIQFGTLSDCELAVVDLLLRHGAPADWANLIEDCASKWAPTSAAGRALTALQQLADLRTGDVREPIERMRKSAADYRTSARGHSSADYPMERGREVEQLQHAALAALDRLRHRE
jgi:hypothetical protein